jgi:hypothetical protein
MYLDQQKETVVCSSNCTFGRMNTGGVTDDRNAAILVGADAFAANGANLAILRLNQGFIKSSGVSGYQDINFDTNTAGATCACTVALGDGMLNVSTGTIASNQTSQIAGPIFYGGPSVGTPLQLNANEMGLAVSTDTAAYPGSSGLKLRVECSTAFPGTARIVAIAGANTGSPPAPTIVADNIGTCP